MNRLLLLIVIVVVIIIIVLCLFYYHHLYRLYISCASLDSTGPFPDLSNRPSVKRLLEAYPRIKRELLRNAHNFSSIEGDLFFGRDVTRDGKWSKIYLKWYADPPRYAERLFPETMAVLKECPDLHLAMFSKLAPGARILPHWGPFAGCIRGHLGLITPKSDECFIIVDGRKRRWRNGEMLFFDDTYEHEVHNNTNEERVVLFFDIERNVRFNWLNRFVIKHFAAQTTRVNDELERRSFRSGY